MFSVSLPWRPGPGPGGLAAAALLLIPHPAAATGSEAAPFEAPRDAASYARALRCLTEAVYYEARSEALDGQRAVAQVVLNRVRHPAYPNSVCGVVYQGSERRTGCQFTFTCDGSIGRAIEGGAWERAERVAQSALGGSVHRQAGLALNYHTTAIRPYWAPSLIRHAVIGSHIFYRQPGSSSLAAFRQEPADREPRRAVAAAGAARAARSGQAMSATGPVRYETARLERAVIERPRVEQPLFERPVSNRTGGVRRIAAFAPARPAAPARIAAAPARQGPRTTLEGGVRVSRGS